MITRRGILILPYTGKFDVQVPLPGSQGKDGIVSRNLVGCGINVWPQLKINRASVPNGFLGAIHPSPSPDLKVLRRLGLLNPNSSTLASVRTHSFGKIPDGSVTFRDHLANVAPSCPTARAQLTLLQRVVRDVQNHSRRAMIVSSGGSDRQEWRYQHCHNRNNRRSQHCLR
ncbi:MAG: hypothetical protein M3198_19970 [Actinomycetota bacterium]|nr:hypothetical protein [Actinomycetota bacterium]